MVSRNHAIACVAIVSGALIAVGCDSPFVGGEDGLGGAGGITPASGGAVLSPAGGKGGIAAGGALGKGGVGTSGAGHGGVGNTGAAGEGGIGSDPLIETGGSAGSLGSGGSAGTVGHAGSSAGTAGSPATTVTVMIQDFDDVYVDHCNPNVNQGAASTLLVDADPCVYQSLLKPSLALVPSGAVVKSATLNLVCFDIGGKVDVSTVATAWAETSANWTNRPAAATKVASFVPALGVVSIDLSAQVKSWVDGEKVLGLLLTQTSVDGSDYYSSEAEVVASRPTLIITYTQ